MNRVPRGMRPAAGAVSIGVLVILVFGRSVGFDFVNIDDPIYVTNNDVVRSGSVAEQLGYALTTTDDGNYIPLSWLSHVLVVRAFGMAPAAHHLVNVLLHGLAAALFFVFLSRATGERGLAATATLLFALHPLRVESVAWVAERKDVLVAVFWMAGLVAYDRYGRRPRVSRYLVVAALFGAALLSKSMAVTFPCVLLLLDVWPLRRGRWPMLIAEKLPLFALAAAVSVVTVLSQRAAGALYTADTLSPGTRVLNALAGYAAYVVQTVWPVGLSVYYPALEGAALYRQAAVGAVLLMGISAGAVALRRRAPFVLVGWLWFMGVLVPVSGIVQVGSQAYADRYTYLPHAGLAIAVVWGVAELVRRSGAPGRVARVAVGVIVVALAPATWNQLGHWRSSETLFRHALSVTEANRFAEGNYALALYARNDFSGAEKHLRRAIAIDPTRATDYHNLGRVLMDAGRTAEAEVAFMQAVALEPDRLGSWLNLGDLRLAAGRPAAAVEAYEHVLRMDPALTGTRVNLAIALAQSGRLDAAAEAFETALAYAPDDARVHFNYGVLLTRLGRDTESIARLTTAAELDPTHAESRYALSVVLVQAGFPDEALAYLAEALALAPALADRAGGDARLDPLRSMRGYQELVGS